MPKLGFSDGLWGGDTFPGSADRGDQCAVYGYGGAD